MQRIYIFLISLFLLPIILTKELLLVQRVYFLPIERKGGNTGDNRHNITKPHKTQQTINKQPWEATLSALALSMTLSTG